MLQFKTMTTQDYGSKIPSTLGLYTPVKFRQRVSQMPNWMQLARDGSDYSIHGMKMKQHCGLKYHSYVEVLGDQISSPVCCTRVNCYPGLGLWTGCCKSIWTWASWKSPCHVTLIMQLLDWLLAVWTDGCVFLLTSYSWNSVMMVFHAHKVYEDGTSVGLFHSCYSHLKECFYRMTKLC